MITEKIRIIDHIINAPTDSQQAIDSSFDAIPIGENKDNWIGIQNPKNGKLMFFEVPKNTEKNLFKRDFIFLESLFLCNEKIHTSFFIF